jgi:hypothetical protein
MADPSPLKSILKKSPASALSSYPASSSFSSTSAAAGAASSSSSPATSRADRDRELALYHANLLQQRKDVEFTIVLNMEKLIEYPLVRTAPHTDASNPSPSDARSFKELLRPFQPSDYDALIEERNINDHCGYALCPRPRVRESGGGIYRLLGMNGKAKDFKVVKKEELEKWCSEACAKRALYVRVQLSESPAWEREGSTGADIELLDESKSAEDQVVEGLERMKLGGGSSSSNAGDVAKLRDATNLAMERGETSTGKVRSGMMDIRIQENQPRGQPQPPSFDTEELSGRLDTMHLSMEGHTPSFDGIRRQRWYEEEYEPPEEDDVDVDRDWM